MQTATPWLTERHGYDPTSGIHFALRRIETVSRCPRVVTAAKAISPGIRRAPECCVQRGIRLSGLPDPAPAFLVSEPPPRCSSRCRPPWLSLWVHPLVRLSSLQSFSSHRPPGRAEHLPWASIPHRDINRRSPLTQAPPRLLRSVLDVSHAPDGFLLHRPCGFVSPRCHVQGSLFRVFPSREAVRARHPPLPSCRLHWPPALSFIQWRQGTVPASRAFLHSRVRGEQWWFRPLPARYPPELLPSSGSSSRAVRTTFVAPPTTAFHGPRRVTSARPDLLLRACLPRPRFLA